MKRLFAVCEGQTEAALATDVLKPHLAQISEYQLDVSAPNLGGYLSYTKMKKFILSLLRSAGPDGAVTTMIDLFGLSTDFPGRAERQDVMAVTRKFSEDIGDSRFLPYLQRHEFEALILTDVSVLAEMYPNRKPAIAELKRRLAKFAQPELVNHDKPPSHRIQEAIPEYSKVSSGSIVTVRIGLPKLRTKCPHFGEWVGKLESLAEQCVLGSSQ